MSDEPAKVTINVRGADIAPFYFDITDLSEFEAIMKTPDTLIKHVLDEMPDGNAKQKKLKQELAAAYGTENYELDKLTDELLKAKTDSDNKRDVLKKKISDAIENKKAITPGTAASGTKTKDDKKRVRLLFRRKVIVETGTDDVKPEYKHKKTGEPIAIDISKVMDNFIDDPSKPKTKPTKTTSTKTTKQLVSATLYLTFVVIKPKEYNRHSAKFVFMKNRVKYPDTLTGHVSSPFIRLSNFIIEEYKPRPFTLDWFEQNMHDIDEKIYLTELARFGDMDIPKKVINVSVDGYKRAADLFPSSGGTRKNKPYSSRRVTRRR